MPYWSAMTRTPLSTSFPSVIRAVLLLLFTAVSAAGQSQLTYERSAPPELNELLTIRERFVYSVRYGFFNLGEIEVELLPDTTWQGQRVHHMRTIMRSSGIPLMGRRDVHYHSYFFLENGAPHGVLFWREDHHDNEPDRSRIEFDRQKEEVRFFERGEPEDTLQLVEPAGGGDNIFYYARAFAGTDREFEIPVYVSNEQGSVKAVNKTEREQRKYDAFPGEIAAYRLEGQADIDGPFGFNGRFRAWFSADDLRVPLEAHLRIFLGNVRIRLISWEIVKGPPESVD